MPVPIFENVLWMVLQRLISISCRGYLRIFCSHFAHYGKNSLHPLQVLQSIQHELLFGIQEAIGHLLESMPQRVTECLSRIHEPISKKNYLYFFFFFENLTNCYLLIGRRFCQVWSKNSYPFLVLQLLCHRV